jgi:hypothetical protein
MEPGFGRVTVRGAALLCGALSMGSTTAAAALVAVGVWIARDFLRIPELTGAPLTLYTPDRYWYGYGYGYADTHHPGMWIAAGNTIAHGGGEIAALGGAMIAAVMAAVFAVVAARLAERSG